SLNSGGMSMESGKAGRLADFEAFVTADMPRLLGYAHALTGNRQAADDLVQEALIRTGLSWHRIRQHELAAAYVKNTILRLYLNQRRGKFREYVDIDTVDPSVAEPGYERIEHQDDLRQALAQLPPGMRAVLVLRYLEGMPDAEIAQLLKCSKGTVRAQAFRGLAKLRVAY